MKKNKIEIRYKLNFMAILLPLFMIASANITYAATYYASPNGSDSSSGGTYANPWKTLNYAVSRLNGGDTLILKSGTYYNLNQENRITPPSGGSTSYTTIKAEDNFQAIIDCNGFGWNSPVAISGKSYIQIEGLKFVNSTAYESCIYVDNSNHIKLMKISIHNGVGADDNSHYGTPIRIRDSNYCLVEDVFASGRMRYGILVRSEYSDKVANHIILRRCVVRWDFANTDQPIAGISIYGTDASTTINNILLQNCIVLDWNPGNLGTKASIYGGFYCPHVTKDITYQGCIALNIHATCSLTSYDQALSGFYLADNKDLNTNRAMYNCLSWDTRGPAVWIEGGIAMITTLDQLTCGDADSNTRDIHKTVYDKPSGVSNLTNSLFYNNAYNNQVDNSNYNWYWPAGQAQGSNYRSDNPAIQYILRTPDTGTGLNGEKRGATILKRYGASGTLWGEAGYDQITNENLWPWPFESQIRADFRQANNPTTGCIPSTNDPTRGFCADGQTLTKYIWEYLGNTIPPEIYGSTDTTAPAAVNNLSATTGSNEGQINLSWTAPGNDGTTGTAATYIMKYSTSSITNDTAFNAATNVTGEPNPVQAGTPQTMTISNLVPGQVYYFALKTQDEVPNTSGLSKSPSAMAKENIVVPDTTPPYTSGHSPSKGATGVALTTPIVVHVKDDGAGVDVETIVMKINGQVVTPVITGTPVDYTLTYTPPAGFEYGEDVTVTVEAWDLANN